MKLNVLIIEDNPPDALMAKRIIDPVIGGGNVYVAETLEDARTIWTERHDIDVVILDLNLPDSDGFQTLYKFREFAVDVPVVIFTTTAGLPGGLDSLINGVSQVLLKDAREEKLASAIIRAVDLYRQQSQLSRETESRMGALAASFNEVMREQQRIIKAISGNGKSGVLSRLGRLEGYFRLLVVGWVVGLVVLGGMWWKMWNVSAALDIVRVRVEGLK